MKSCSRCKELKKYSEFHRNKKMFDGLSNYCKKCKSISNKKYISNNKEKIKEINKEYRDRLESKENQKNWWKENPDKKKEYRERYNREKEKEDRKRWYKSFKERNPHILAWRTLLTNTLKRFGKNKESDTIKLLGYSALQLKEHIESLFLEGMTWDNYGEWHIDHIKMVSHFESNTPMNIVNSLENLRPLWAKDNCSRKLN